MPRTSRCASVRRRALMGMVSIALLSFDWTRGTVARTAQPARNDRRSAPAILSASSRPDPQTLLRFVDAARAPAAGAEIHMRVDAVRARERNTRRYRVLDGGAGSSIVEFLDPIEKGRKVLATPTDLWFFSPRLHRAIRIPAAQRVFGDATYADIARLHWSSGYVATYDEPAEELLQGKPCWRLRLRSTTATAAYRTIILWVASEDWVPQRAAYFVASGKQLKTATFPDARTVDGHLENPRWVLSETGTSTRHTELVIESAIPRIFAPNQFTRRRLELDP